MYGYEIAIAEALAERIRLRITLLLWDSTICVTCLSNVMQAHQSTVSRHLAILRKSGLVGTIRNGTYIYYTLDFEGEFGDLKRNLVKSFYVSLSGNGQYMEDALAMKKHEDDCTAGCKVAIGEEEPVAEFEQPAGY